MKRKVVIAVLMLMVLNVSSVSYAATEKNGTDQIIAIKGQEGIQPFYDKTYNISAALKIEGNVAHATAHVTAKRPYHVSVVMRLQRKEGSDWHTIVSWVAGSADGFKNLTKTHTLTTRGTYRVYALFDVDGEKLEYVGNTATY